CTVFDTNNGTASRSLSCGQEPNTQCYYRAALLLDGPSTDSSLVCACCSLQNVWAAYQPDIHSSLAGRVTAGHVDWPPLRREGSFGVQGGFPAQKLGVGSSLTNEQTIEYWPEGRARLVIPKVWESRHRRDREVL
ncbi:uncharacterized protein GLRG_04140, partial [Colletotrichum graminicola M1.001]